MSLSHALKSEMRDNYINDQKHKWKLWHNKGLWQFEGREITYHSRDQRKKFKKEVAFETVFKQGNSTVKTQPWKVWNVNRGRGKRKQPGKITEGPEDRKKWKNKFNPLWINKLWYIHRMEDYSAITRHGILIYATTWMNFKNIRLGAFSWWRSG